MSTTAESVFVADHRRILGACWIVYGIARVLLAFWLLAFHITAKLMFGALMTRVPNPYTLMDSFEVFYTAIVIFSVICGLLGVLAGLALLATWSAGRPVALAAAFLPLSELPLGLMLGVYTIVVLLPRYDARISPSEPEMAIKR
jgi:hypothetical protein